MSDCFQDEGTAPGAKIPVKGDIVLNAQRKTVKLKVTSLCDRPIQVCTQFVSYALWHDVVVSIRKVCFSCDYFYLRNATGANKIFEMSIWKLSVPFNFLFQKVGELKFW